MSTPSRTAASSATQLDSTTTAQAGTVFFAVLAATLSHGDPCPEGPTCSKGVDTLDDSEAETASTIGSLRLATGGDSSDSDASPASAHVDRWGEVARRFASAFSDCSESEEWPLDEPLQEPEGEPEEEEEEDEPEQELEEEAEASGAVDVRLESPVGSRFAQVLGGCSEDDGASPVDAGAWRDVAGRFASAFRDCDSDWDEDD
mmetsp:Transcript_29145/g.78675  ORF Transcript_29145/g.78675 Transcript_29145/m.78675 type:complete len:203 (-) Transcript_29145:84-692(-)